MMLQQLRKVYPPVEIAFMQSMGEVAHQFGVSAYIVGGMPRDLLLGRYCADIDILIEGDAIKFCKFVHAHWADEFGDFEPPSKAIAFKRYGTAKLTFANEVFPGVDLIEFATARSEVYPSSGQAPVIISADLSADLARRDFSMNAMAMSLSNTNFGHLHDAFSGRRDLEKGRLAVLHKKSFEDDPARLIRAVRLMTRLNLSFSEETGKLFQQAVSGGYLGRIPRARCFDEFRKALSGPLPVEVLLCLQRYGLLVQIDSVLTLSEDVLEGLKNTTKEAANKKSEISGKEESKLWEKLLFVLYKHLGKAEFERTLMDFKLDLGVIRRLLKTF